jgi:hypothetical protein
VVPPDTPGCRDTPFGNHCCVHWQVFTVLVKCLQIQLHCQLSRNRNKASSLARQPTVLWTVFFTVGTCLHDFSCCLVSCRTAHSLVTQLLAIQLTLVNSLLNCRDLFTWLQLLSCELSDSLPWSCNAAVTLVSWQVHWCRPSTPLGGVLREKLVVVQQTHPFRTRRFITVFAVTHYWTLSWASWIHFTSSYRAFNLNLNVYTHPYLLMPSSGGWCRLSFQGAQESQVFD